MKVYSIDPEALEQMRSRGGTWAAYENQVMDSAACGHMTFLQFGEGCTFKEPPTQYPDTATGPGWKYRLVGVVELKSGSCDKLST